MKIWHPTLLLALAACGGKDDDDTETQVGPDPDPVPDTYDTGGPTSDADNSIDAATPLMFDLDVDGVISPAGDVDWYTVTVDEPTWIRVDTVTQGDRAENLDTAVRVWAPDGGGIYAFMDNYATGTVGTYDTILYAYLDEPGTWGLTVEDVFTFYDGYESYVRGGRDFTYTVGVSRFTGTTSEPDSAAEPSSGILLESGSSIFAVGVNIETPGDIDYIALETSLAGYPLEVWGSIGNTGSDLASRVRLLDPDGTLIAQKDDVGPGGKLSYFDPDAGIFTVEISDADGGGGPSSWFVAYMRTYDDDFVSADFGTAVYETEIEPNDLADNALFSPTFESPIFDTFADVSAVQGTISAAGDVDWFGIPVDTPDDRFSIRCFTEEFGSLLDLRVTAEFEGDEIATSTDVGDNFYYILDVPVAGPGNVRVKIESESGQGSPAAYYRCRLITADFDIY